MSKFIILINVVLLSVYLTEQKHLFRQEFVDKINANAKTWKAKLNFPDLTTKEQIAQLVSKKPLFDIPKSAIKKDDKLYADDAEIPDFFDARLKWEHCKTIGQVRNQGSCYSDWAHSTTGAFADRLCIATNGDFNQLLSADELMFCYPEAGDGCNEGYPFKSWQSFQKYGIVTGGNYHTKDGCQPYRIPPCNDKIRHNICYSEGDHDNEVCRRKCYGDKTIRYKTGHYKTKDAYQLTNDTMQKDIMLYGPIEATLLIDEDFASYDSGVYQSDELSQRSLGSLSVKVIGWGVEDGTPYWLCVNSWGENWGDNGMFKIRRGTDECGIENWPTAGVPLLQK